MENEQEQAGGLDHKPKGEIVIRFCKNCGRDSLVQPLKDIHYSHGSLCQGAMFDAIYTLTRLIQCP